MTADDLTTLTAEEIASLPAPTDAEWSAKFKFLAKLRNSFLNDPTMTLEELCEISEHQLIETELWWRGLTPEDQAREARWLQPVIHEVRRLQLETAAKARALLKRYRAH
jgi:hypothetical protein